MTITKIGKGWHAAAAQRDLRCNLLWREALSHIDERRILRRRARQVLAVTQTALIVIDPCAGARGRLILREGQHARHLIRVYVNHAAHAIDGRPSPFGASKKTGEHHRLLVKSDGYKLAPTAKGGKLLHRTFVCFRRARRQ